MVSEESKKAIEKINKILEENKEQSSNKKNFSNKSFKKLIKYLNPFTNKIAGWILFFFSLFIFIPNILTPLIVGFFGGPIDKINHSVTNEDIFQPDSSCLQRKSFEFVYKSNDDYTMCSDGMLNFYDNKWDTVFPNRYVSYYREIPLDTIISIEIDSYTKLQLWMLEGKLTDNITDSFNLLILKSKLEQKNYLLYEKFEVLKTDTKFFNSNIKNTVMANDTIQLRTNISSRNNYIISEKILKNYKFYITEESTYYRDLN